MACLILALIAVVLGFGTILTAPWLPVSVAGLRARRVIRGVAAGAIALAVIGLLCLM